MRSFILMSAVLVGALVASAEVQDQTAPQQTGRMSRFFNGLRNRLGGYVQTDSGITEDAQTKPVSQPDLSSEIEKLKAAIKGIETLMGQLMEQIQQQPEQKQMRTQETGQQPGLEKEQGNPLDDQVIATPATELIQHSPPSDQFTKAGLMNRLVGLHFDGPYQGKVAEFVAEQLYATMDKQTTELFNGVTVKELIDQNQMELKDCSVEAFKDRSRFYLKTLPQRVGESGVVFGVNVYALRLLRSASEYCTRYQDEVVIKSINKAGWLRLLASASRQDEESIESSVARVDEEFAHSWFISNLATFIEGSYDAAWFKMMSLRREPEQSQPMNK